MTAKTIPLVVIAVFLLAQVVWVSLSPTLVQAAPTISTPATTGNMSSSLNPSGTKAVAYNAGTGTGRILVVSVASNSRTNKMNSVSYGPSSGSAVALTQAFGTGQLAPSSATARVQLFYLLNPSSGANNVYFTASAAGTYAYSISYISGADTTGVGTVSNNSGTGTSLTINNVPSAANSLIVTAFASDSTTGLTPAGNPVSTEVGDVAGSSGIRDGLYVKNGSSAGSTITTQASGANVGWAAISLEIKLPVPVPDVSVSAGNNDGQEPGNVTSGTNIDFTFSRLSDDEDYSEALNISFDRGGSATYNVDYLFDEGLSTCQNVSGDTVRIPAGESNCLLVARPLQDEEYTEDTETIDITINEGGSSYQLGESYSETAYIVNTPDQSSQGGGEEMGPCTEYWCVYTVYTIDSPGYASMYVYDDDTVPSGSFSGGFSASPTRVQVNGTARLTWGTTGMLTCSIDNDIGAVPTSGFVDTPPITRRTTFTLTCNDGVSDSISRVTVGIVPSFIEQ